MNIYRQIAGIPVIAAKFASLSLGQAHRSNRTCTKDLQYNGQLVLKYQLLYLID